MADPLLTHLELGLDHEQEVGVVGCGPQQRLEDESQRDKGEVADHELGGGSDGGGVQHADVGSVQGGDARIAAQGPGQLAVADVNGHDVLGTAA